MKCLVTGARGFIGSYLVEFLLQKGHDGEMELRKEVIPEIPEDLQNIIKEQG